MHYKIILLSLLIALSPFIRAQDVIIWKNGDELQAKVLEITTDEVRYKRFDNPDGPTYYEEKAKILKVKYANGSQDVFVNESNAYTVQHYSKQPRTGRKVRYSGMVEFAPYVGGDYENDRVAPGAAITTTHGVRLVDRYFLGLGIGVNFDFSDNDDSRIYIPVFTAFRFDFNNNPSHPFLNMTLGMQVGTFTTTRSYSYTYERTVPIGFWSDIMIGYQFSNRLYISAGLTIQNSTSYYYDDYYNDGHYYYDGDHTNLYGMVGFKLGLGVRF